jgi:Holliday junction DNA helicase RuvA
VSRNSDLAEGQQLSEPSIRKTDEPGPVRIRRAPQPFADFPFASFPSWERGAGVIATLAGTLRFRDAGRLILEAGGIGYEIFIPLSTYYRIPATGTRVELEIRQVVREDAITLYGFATSAEKAAFDLLIGIQHVGPKLALAVLSVLAPEDLASAIAHEDIARIDSVPGVGAKVAERVVRELRDKIGALTHAPSHRIASAVHAEDGAESSVLNDAVSALINLGYKPAEAKRAVDAVGVGETGTSLETLLRKSLAVILGEK